MLTCHPRLPLPTAGPSSSLACASLIQCRLLPPYLPPATCCLPPAACSFFKKRLLKDTSPWLVQPDYDRVRPRPRCAVLCCACVPFKPATRTHSTRAMALPLPQVGSCHHCAACSTIFLSRPCLPLACPCLPASPACLQVLFINSILQILWPHLSPAIHKLVMEQAAAPLAEACKKVGAGCRVAGWGWVGLDGWHCGGRLGARGCAPVCPPAFPTCPAEPPLCCNPRLWRRSTSTACFIAQPYLTPPHAPPHAPPTYLCVQAKVLETIRIDRLDLGTRPPRVDCFKSFETAEDELIIEVSGRWILRHGCCGVLCMLRVLWVLWVLWCCRCWPLRCLPAAKAAS